LFEQTFKNIDVVLRRELSTELDYIEQTSWVLFLRYLDQLENDKADEAELRGEEYNFIIKEEYRWSNWAMPLNDKGELDHHKALTGTDLIEFVSEKLFPYLAKFKIDTENAKTIEYKIGEIFNEISNRIKSGYSLREIINYSDQLVFNSAKQKHELSELYETKIKNMGNAGRNGGEYYTPRALIRAMIHVVDPQIGEKIYDSACGSCGFLCESYDYIYHKMEKSVDNLKLLQEETLFGKEKKPLAYIIGIMNMILHGIEAPNIIYTNTLGENIRDIQERNRYHVILANPPFGGKERKEIQQNFDIKTSETASLFLQHFIKSLKTGGRAAVVIKNTFLTNADNASVALRRHLLDTCNLDTILDLPVGTCTGVGQKTVVLFFTKGVPTKKIWTFELKVDRSLGKRSPLNDNDFSSFLNKESNNEISENSWFINVSDIDNDLFAIKVKNPNKNLRISLRKPEIIAENITSKNNSISQILNNKIFQDHISFLNQSTKKNWPLTTLQESCEFFNGKAHEKSIDAEGSYVVVNSKFISSDGLVRKFTKEQKFPLLINDVVLVMSDVPNGKALAKCFLIDEEKKYSLNQRICAIRSKNFVSKFLYYQLNRNKYFLKFNNGENQTNLRKGDILNCPLIIPPLDEQLKIVKVMAEIVQTTKKIEEYNKKNEILIDELKLNLSNLPFHIQSKEE